MAEACGISQAIIIIPSWYCDGKEGAAVNIYFVNSISRSRLIFMYTQDERSAESHKNKFFFLLFFYVLLLISRWNLYSIPNSPTLATVVELTKNESSHKS